MKKQIETLDLTPTWKSLIRFLLELYIGAEGESLRMLNEEFMKMAKGADRFSVYTSGEEIASLNPFVEKVDSMLREYMITKQKRGSRIELEFEYMAFLCDEWIAYQKLKA